MTHRGPFQSLPFCDSVLPVPGVERGLVGNVLELTSTDFPWGNATMGGNFAPAVLPRLGWREQR